MLLKLTNNCIARFAPKHNHPVTIPQEVNEVAAFWMQQDMYIWLGSQLDDEHSYIPQFGINTFLQISIVF